MYRDSEELLLALSERLSEVPLEEIKGDHTLNRLMGLYRAYMDAMEEAKQYGWIGVGCITFAENRLRSLQQLPLVQDNTVDSRGFNEYGHYGEQNHPLDKG